MFKFSVVVDLGTTFSSNPVARTHTHTQAYTPTSPSRTHSFKTPPFYHHHCSRHRGYTPPRTCQSQLTGLVCISHTSFSTQKQHVFHHTNTTAPCIRRHTKLYFSRLHFYVSRLHRLPDHRLAKNDGYFRLSGGLFVHVVLSFSDWKNRKERSRIKKKIYNFFRFFIGFYVLFVLSFE